MRAIVPVLLAVLLCGAAPPRDGSTRERPGSDPSAEPGARVAAVEAPPAQGTSWFALPVLFWLPETKLGFGATGGVHHHLGGAARPSSAFLTAVYTLEGQGSLDLAADVYGAAGAVLSGRARLVYFPDAFYGIGPRTTIGDREEFTRRFAEATTALEWPIGTPHLRAGPRVDLRREIIADVAADSRLASGEIPGSDGFSAAGAGASVSWDTRDSTLWTTSGSYVQASFLAYPGVGEQPRFARGGVEGRAFLPLGAGRVLGFAAATEAASRETPFTLLPRLGSTRYLRGYREGRYRDRLSWWAQSELRVPLAWRLSAVGFAAVGDVAPSARDLSLETVKLAGGAGLRVRLTREGANVRIDVAASRAGVELYVLVLEAF
jgi:hypothetical protein